MRTSQEMTSRFISTKAKKADRGFTLVELLVAITILAIIAIPLMHGFVTAATTNAKARQVEQATTVARNLMEEIKVTPVEDLLEQEGVYTEVISGMMTMEGEMLDMVNYVISYEDIVTDGASYSARVTLEPGLMGDDGLDQITDYNQRDLAQLYDMNAAYDAFFILEEVTDEALIEELAVAAGVSSARVREDVERHIYLDIKQELATRIVEVNVSYTYQGDTRYMAAENQCIYSSSSRDTFLRNVYVFFEPLGNMQEQDEPKESVTVRHTCCEHVDEPTQIYLVKQGSEQDANYALNVNLMEQSRDIASYQDASGEMQVLTRICTNISFPKMASDRTADQIAIRYSTWDGGYQENISLLGSTYTADDLAGLKDLAVSKSQEWVYKVYVSVYKRDAEGNEEEVVFLIGTKEK